MTGYWDGVKSVTPGSSPSTTGISSSFRDVGGLAQHDRLAGLDGLERGHQGDPVRALEEAEELRVAGGEGDLELVGRLEDGRLGLGAEGRGPLVQERLVGDAGRPPTEEGADLLAVGPVVAAEDGADGLPVRAQRRRWPGRTAATAANSRLWAKPSSTMSADVGALGRGGRRGRGLRAGGGAAGRVGAAAGGLRAGRRWSRRSARRPSQRPRWRRHLRPGRRDRSAPADGSRAARSRRTAGRHRRVQARSGPRLALGSSPRWPLAARAAQRCHSLPGWARAEQL